MQAVERHELHVVIAADAFALNVPGLPPTASATPITAVGGDELGTGDGFPFLLERRTVRVQPRVLPCAAARVRVARQHPADPTLIAARRRLSAACRGANAFGKVRRTTSPVFHVRVSSTYERGWADSWPLNR